MKDNKKAAEAMEQVIHYMDYEPEMLGHLLATNMHRTMQQKFMRVIMGYMETQAKNYREGRFDARNEATGQYCAAVEGLAAEYLPENLRVFPFI